MTILRAFAFSPLLALAVPANAAPPAGWTIDRAKSSLAFSGVQTGSRFTGRFNRYNAAIAFDPEHPETARIIATVDLRSASTGDTQRDTALPGKDWFDVAQFPVARFVTTTIRRKGAKDYVATGNLTLHGVTRPVTMPFTLTINGNTAHAKGHVNLVRTAFGVGQGAWSSGQWVALEVGVDIDIIATRAR